MIPKKQTLDGEDIRATVVLPTGSVDKSRQRIEYT